MITVGQIWTSRVNEHPAEIISIVTPDGHRVQQAFNGCRIVLQHMDSRGLITRITELEYRSLRRNYRPSEEP